MSSDPRHRLPPGKRRSHWRRAVVAGIVAAALATDGSPIAAQDDSSTKSGEVVGVVVDAGTEAPLVGAFVSIVESDWGIFTNQDGRFRLGEIAIGPHSITIEHLGYTTIETKVDAAARSGEPVRLLMQPDPILLEGLEIVSDRFRNRRRGAATPVRTFELDVLSTSPSSSLREFLNVRAIAALFPCEGRYSDTCVMARGRRAEALAYFDEVRLAGGWSYLDTFAPHDLYMIEVYDGGRHIRAYSRFFMERAAKTRLFPLPLPR